MTSNGGEVPATPSVLRDPEPKRCHVHLRGWPPYVGGDDDETEEWFGECCACGWTGSRSKYQSIAYQQMIAHLHDAREPWPRAHADDYRLDHGPPHSPDDSNGAHNLFVRCHTCNGLGCDDCGDTGFDWTDTEQARATVRMVCGEDE